MDIYFVKIYYRYITDEICAECLFTCNIMKTITIKEEGMRENVTVLHTIK